MRQATVTAQARWTPTWSHLRNPNRRPWDTLSTLAERLLPPHVRAQFHPNLRLLIVPSGRLHSLPWAPLRVGDHWLCEQAIVQLLPSLSLWRPSTIEPEANQAALLIGCSQFSRRARDLFTITTELNCIANVWPSEITQLVNDAATRDAILKLDAHGRLNKYAVLHIASHAQLIAAQGLLAHVMFWDEDFLYDEVARLRLNDVLVVLSTCNGALSEVLPGEEVLSLNRAFLRAGARDVIANLWPSYDLASPHLMQLLYEHIVAGLDAAESVAQMQRQLITQTEAAYNWL